MHADEDDHDHDGHCTGVISARQVAAKKLDRRLEALGAAPLLERGLGDDQVRRPQQRQAAAPALSRRQQQQQVAAGNGSRHTGSMRSKCSGTCSHCRLLP